jgi:hypothetical protein
MTKRDAQGRYVEKTLDPEKASEMAKKRWEKTKEAKGGRADELLVSLGLVGAGEEVEILAEVAAEQGPRSISAMGKLIDLSEKYRNKKTIKVKPDQACPVCGREASGNLFDFMDELEPGEIPPEALDIVEDMLEDLDRLEAVVRG